MKKLYTMVAILIIILAAVITAVLTLVGNKQKQLEDKKVATDSGFTSSMPMEPAVDESISTLPYVEDLEVSVNNNTVISVTEVNVDIQKVSDYYENLGLSVYIRPMSYPESLGEESIESTGMVAYIDYFGKTDTYYIVTDKNTYETYFAFVIDSEVISVLDEDL